MLVGFELSPLNTGMQNIQDVVEDFKVGYLGFWPSPPSGEMGNDISIEILARYFNGEMIVS